MMESWSFVCEEKGLECDVIDSAINPLFISRHPSFGRESRNPSSLNENSQLNKITNNLELKLPDKYRKNVPDNPICEILDGKVGDLPSSNAFRGEDQSTYKLSGSIADSNSKDFPLSDLKLGRFGDLREAYSCKLSNDIVHLSESVAPQKRARVSKLNLQIAFCQVHGCNKDLSSSKDYHKKHKVCESHTKTTKVIVNGIEQRFCQQCSRFQLIAEFDEAKRSCRRRLAGHNERRRKPQVVLPSGTQQRYLQSYNSFAGNMYPRTTSTGTSLIFQDSGFPHSKKLHGMNDWFKPVEVEDINSFTSSTIPSMSNRHLSLKPLFATYDIGAQNGPYPFNIGGIYASPWSMVPHNLSASEVFEAESMVHDLPRISNSGRAHSLLSSSQPHDSSNHFSGLSMLVREASTIAEQCQVASPILASENNGDSFQMNQGILCWPEFQIVKDCFSRERNPTIGLLQLSSQFQRQEDQKAREVRK